MSGSAVRFCKVNKRYGDVAALSDFDLDIGPGEFVTFLGPSGSGKTTALNVLAGFTEASSGDVLINGRSVVDLPPEKRQLGMVFQSYSLFPHLSVFDNVAFPLRIRKLPDAEVRQKAGRSLEMVQLSALANRMPKELSGGQRQRVAFARAVAFEPSVLLMDEPLGALDLKLREAMQLEIKQFHAQLGCTIVFVTHDQGEALVLSDRIVVMDAGRIVQFDTPERIYDHPKTRYVAEFIGKTNILTLQPGAPGQLHVEETGDQIPLAAVAGSGGMPAHISVRPEKLQRMAGSDTDGHSFEVRVKEVLFLGDTILYELVTAQGACLLLQEARGPRSTALGQGEVVRVGYRFSDAFALQGG